MEIEGDGSSKHIYRQMPQMSILERVFGVGQEKVEESQRTISTDMCAYELESLSDCQRCPAARKMKLFSQCALLGEKMSKRELWHSFDDESSSTICMLGGHTEN